MATTVSSPTQVLSNNKAIVARVIAGLAGGVLFGVMMAVMGMLPMMAMLVGSQSALVGCVVHMAISAVIGGIYGLVAARLPGTAVAGIVAVTGVVWWVLGVDHDAANAIKEQACSLPFSRRESGVDYSE